MRFWLVALLLLIGGAAGQDRILIGQPFSLTDQERVLGNVVVLGAPAQIAGQVLGSVVVISGNLTLGPRSLVGKDVVVLAGTLTKAAGARILGETTHVDLPPLPHIGLPGLPPVWLRALLLGTLLLVTGSLLQDLVQQGATRLSQHGWKALAWGAATWVVIPVSGLLLLFTIVGIVLLPFHLLATFAFAVIGMAVSVQWFGQRALPSRSAGLQRLLGTSLLVIVGLVPWLGPITQLLAVLFGSGSLACHVWLHQRQVLQEVH